MHVTGNAISSISSLKTLGDKLSAPEALSGLSLSSFFLILSSSNAWKYGRHSICGSWD